MNIRPYKLQKFFLTGSGGQVGGSLVKELRKIYGYDSILVTDQNGDKTNNIH